MSPISFFQRHPRAGLSAYLDGELTPAAALRLEAHIASCAACAAQLEELRETRSALRSIPKAAAPRSFALTPEMARDARPVRQTLPARRVQPLVNGLRMTSAGLAVAFAVVVVISVSGGGNNNSSNETNLIQLQGGDETAQYSAAAPNADVNRAQGDDASVASTQTPPVPSGPTPTLASGSMPSGAPGSVGGVGGAVGSSPPTDGAGVSVPTATATSPLASPIDVNLDGTGESLDRDIGASSTDVPKAASGEFDSATPVPEALPMTAGAPENDGGLDTLTIMAIVLGVLLAAAFIGSIAASRLARKTP